MHKTHAPEGYVCPICAALDGKENKDTLIHQSDIFYKDDLVTGLINSFSFDGVVGNALIIPNKHFENIYELPTEYGHRIFEVMQKTALAMKQAYNCDGITTLLCNEPAGGQHAFHYHQHVIQRYNDDIFMDVGAKKAVPSRADKAKYARKLEELIGV